jgi:uncharacterized damage-inducible protein DinB
MTDEKSELLRSLDKQRGHILGIVEGLSDDNLRRPVLPTGWTCLGLVQHLALDVERFWFWNVTAGEIAPEQPAPDDAWQVAPDIPADKVLDLYRSQAERGTEVISRTPLDAAPKWWPEGQFGSWRLHDLRQIMLHVITETACHAGHLDATRELIDGRTWVILNR